MTETKLTHCLWLKDQSLQKLLSALCEGNDEARIVGGALRNTLLGEPVNDIDIATTTLPEETIRRAEAAGFKAIPTGIEFGTVTVVAYGRPYEVTTLRADIETDGRHAKVAFGCDWEEDAKRRDFTVNGLYADRNGEVYDYVGGLADIATRNVRFIGETEERIREDYLRILRFFRFFAYYGNGRPDAEAVKASARLKEGLLQLSVERVWSEIKKTLAAPDPSRALLWMRQTGVLTTVLPETERWGIQAIHSLVETGQAYHWGDDPLLRLMSLLPPDQVRMKEMAKRLKFSKAETARVVEWAGCDVISNDCSERDLQKLIYLNGRQPVMDRLYIAMASTREKVKHDPQAMGALKQYGDLLSFAQNWVIPSFPLKGENLLYKGFKEGPELGATLKKLETYWVANDFYPDSDALLALLKDIEQK